MTLFSILTMQRGDAFSGSKDEEQLKDDPGIGFSGLFNVC